MAMRTIEPDPFVPTKYFKPQMIGEMTGGVFVSVAKGQYGQDYRFRQKDGTDVVVTAKGPLANQLAKADLKPGNRVIIKVKGTTPPAPGYDRGFFVYEVKADDEISAIPPAKAVSPSAAPPGGDDDLPF